ncbi:hypothetical protein LWP59_20385 [Amycolatopsis acidiphila]|uniref:Uncharacterized protein n=1 Tax=Amycolatopsis acidiphila TaxID=715473 RepID=A0A558AGD6_9PSEU|nr:hypothetical protein [Amycolatopsis acidiphila]TVT23324.1 hypothetical protein FNH06_10585 [Amycolatopsis acidiphila]UIJ56552.1 hypothetical protein LWP59_20385 [Amycolatopsis acidiphila]GHG66698.1 hypothetical protein GCM10017788_24880 [Amycolatopsis acidiphila]
MGWKVGAGQREHLGGMVIGHLPSATRLSPGGRYDPAEMVADNVFRRAFALGPFLPGWRRMPAELLHAMDEPLSPGEAIITGSVVQVPVAPGDEVRADFPRGRRNRSPESLHPP